jgi:nucleoid-associated protein YgaU
MAEPRPQVTLKTSAGTTLSVLLGEASPVLLEGTTNWETVDRPKRTAITRYAGRSPFKQDISVLFDGYQSDESQESRIAKLERMAGQAHTIKLSGVALRRDLQWVITDVDWDSQNTIWIRTSKGAVRTRQAAIIHLLEYVKDTIVKTPARPTISSKKDPAKKVVLPKGMTLKQIAKIEYGDPDKWRVIVDANPILWGVDDPRYFVPAGITLIIPDGKTAYFTVP